MESTINPPSDPSTHSVAPKLPSLMFDARLVLEVSPYLETLCLLGINRDAAVPEPAEYYIRHLPFRCNGFPCLRELSISGMHTHLFKNISKRRGPLFPALSRLHIMATASNPVNFGRWLREAPHLSELRLQVTMSTSDGLIPKWMLSLERSLKRDPLSLSSDPSFLMLVLVKQEVAVDISEDDTHPSPAYQQHRARLSRLLRCTSSALVPVILVMNYIPFDIVPEQSGNDWSDVEVLQADWLARVSGTNGSSDFWSDWEEHRKELGDSRLRQISGKMPVVMPNRKAQRRVLLAQLNAQLNRLRREYGLEPIS
ncbi:hypothetical protein DICSQDRAFT_161721 [Dichomitus squalens LYAD-421 SS1]|uniref:F-box domain-containing protein n=1 Tax=Dichomitus squalens (strain LYAD-421) TaxID=732165 RepID=R7SZ07_DICSQ|nr:uncharacterized protein DICSQDRAFT_161721 [Dichomitus squalens LYAD-421 SS1]EJF61326.1 hypothetical protein DICSQDRAFT_161721 [Dichomitus squalens LYAD-421 SS1]